MDSIYQNMRSYIIEQVSTKIYDTNTAHQRKYSGTRRDLEVGGCHRLVFQDVFCKHTHPVQTFQIGLASWGGDFESTRCFFPCGGPTDDEYLPDRRLIDPYC